MRKQTIIKRENGDKVNITAKARTETHSLYIVYDIEILLLPKGKRNWKLISFVDDYKYRSLPWNSQERTDYEMAEYLKHVTIEEIKQAKQELWLAMKPE